MRKKDSAGTEHEMVFDSGGRMHEDRVTLAPGSIVDADVLMRRFEYDTEGRLSDVTQWDTTTPDGSAVPLDAAQFTFDDWKWAV